MNAIFRWSLAALFSILGVLFGFCLPGYLWIGMLCFGIAGLLVVYYLLRNHRRGKHVLTVLLLICIVCLLAVEIPILRSAFQEPEEEVDVLIVLGAQVRGTTPSRSMLDRLTATATYLEAHPDTIAIVSGGQGLGESITEAQAMYDWLVSNGIDVSRIWIEPEATSTEENLTFSFRMIEEKAGTNPSVGIVSSEYHLYRATYMAEKMLGISTVGVPAHTTYPLMMVNYFLREAAAVVVLWLQG